MTTYGNSKSAVNEKVGEIGQESGYSNSVPGLIKRLDGIKERIASDELNIENLQDQVGQINALLGYQWVKIWENENPNVTFEEETIAFLPNSERFPLYCVIFKWSNFHRALDACFVLPNGTLHLFSKGIAIDNSIYFARRNITITQDFITFAQGTRRIWTLDSGVVSITSDVNNSGAIPLYVFGLKEVN